MKKFLKKKPVMVTFLSLAVIFLIIYTCLLVRPGTTLMPYKTTRTTEIGGVKTVSEYTITFKGGKKAEVETEIATTSQFGSNTSDSDEEIWVHFDGYNVITGPSTEAVTKDEFVKELKDLKKDAPKTYKASMSKVNAFKMETKVGLETITLKNTGAVVFAIVGGVVELVLIGFATMSIVASKSKKKK